MMQELKASRKARLAGMALLLVTFVAGTLAGAAANRVVVDREAPAAEGREGDRRERRPSTEDFLSRLELTAEQRTAIDSILDMRRGQIDGIWKEMRPRMRALGDSARVEIGSVLTDEQREAYEAFLREQRERHRGGRGPDDDSRKNGKQDDEKR